jgi:endonuclease YncB( thermonuclease family)
MCRFALACLFAAALAGNASAQEIRCTFEDAGTGTVRAVLDGRTLALTDGREVRLAAIEVPDAEPAGKLALEKMLGGRAVKLKRVGEEKDRHGRLLAHVFAADDTRSMQQTMLAAGHARVAARVGDMACARQLLGAEQAARAAGLGLWSDAAYAPRRVDDPAAVLAERGRLTLVEGKVVSVRESGGTIYVNFGARWSEDFTASVLKRNERVFAVDGLELKKLAGRAVRLRGVIEERGGPWIELIRPEQVELLGGR